jgi:hypothetical protein
MAGGHPLPPSPTPMRALERALLGVSRAGRAISAPCARRSVSPRRPVRRRKTPKAGPRPDPAPRGPIAARPPSKAGRTVRGPQRVSKSGVPAATTHDTVAAKRTCRPVPAGQTALAAPAAQFESITPLAGPRSSTKAGTATSANPIPANRCTDAPSRMMPPINSDPCHACTTPHPLSGTGSISGGVSLRVQGLCRAWAKASWWWSPCTWWGSGPRRDNWRIRSSDL